MSNWNNFVKAHPALQALPDLPEAPDQDPKV